MVSATDLDLQWLSRPDDVADELRVALTACWRDVVNAGGAVGFAELAPLTDDDVAPVVDEIVAGLDPRLSRLLVAMRGSDLTGWLLLTGNDDPVVAHWGRVTRLQTAVSARGSGVARELMAELHRSARDDLGLESLRLEVRGGMGFALRRVGWVCSAWPAARSCSSRSTVVGTRCSWSSSSDPPADLPRIRCGGDPLRASTLRRSCILVAEGVPGGARASPVAPRLFRSQALGLLFRRGAAGGAHGGRSRWTASRR